MGALSEAWLREAFCPPPASLRLARKIIEPLDLRLKPKGPALSPDRLGLAASPAGITRVFLRRGGEISRSAREAGRIGKLLDQARKELAEYLAGERTFFTVPVDLSRLQRFERAALLVAAEIPYGEVRSYKWIAERLGWPDAVREGKSMASLPTQQQ